MPANPTISIERLHDDFSRPNKWCASVGPFHAYGTFPRDALDNLLNSILDSSLDVAIDIQLAANTLKPPNPPPIQK
jgi:hypothetical protein